MAHGKVRLAGTIQSLLATIKEAAEGAPASTSSQPVFQSGSVPTSMSTVNNVAYRTTPDVSFVGGTDSEVSIYDSLSSGWSECGGTSLSAPCWAGLIAIADQGRAIKGLGSLGSSSTSGYELQTALYNLPPSDFHDITSGFNGYNAGSGYDLVTGLGSPKANSLIPDWRTTSSRTRRTYPNPW